MVGLRVIYRSGMTRREAGGNECGRTSKHRTDHTRTPLKMRGSAIRKDSTSRLVEIYQNGMSTSKHYARYTKMGSLSRGGAGQLCGLARTEHVGHLSRFRDSFPSENRV